MNLSFHGDSYDLVKRFFCTELKVLGYRITIDPMLTNSPSGDIAAFCRLIGASPVAGASVVAEGESALFLDPDTGVHDKDGKMHVSFKRIEDETLNHSLVFCFDQSFSRGSPACDVIQKKLKELVARDCSGMFYNSHARFLFAARQTSRLERLHKHLVDLGLPDSRLIKKYRIE